MFVKSTTTFADHRAWQDVYHVPARDWRFVYDDAVRQLAEGADAVLAVTPYVDDENPLWVERGADGYAERIGGGPVTPPCVTGGVYALPRPGDAHARRASVHVDL